MAVENKPPGMITTLDLKKIIYAVAVESGQGSAKRTRQVLRGAFHLAVDGGLVSVDPLMGWVQKADRLNPASITKKSDGLDHDRAPTDDEVGY